MTAPTSQSNLVAFSFSPQSFQDLQTLSQQLQVPPAQVISDALNLLKLAQGRKMVLRDNAGTEVTISSYIACQQQVAIEVKSA
jgi:hypothetical protein